MSKEELIQILMEYKTNQAKKNLRLLEKKRLQKQIEKINTDYETSVTPQFQEGGKGNEVVSKVENKVIKKEDRISEIEKKIKDIEDELEELDYKLNQVDIRLGSLKRIEKEVITAYYIDKMDYKKIGNITYYNVKQQTRSEDTIKRMINKIIVKLSKL